MVILHWYKYLFYRVYEWRSHRPKTPISQPEFDAAWFIALANGFYIIAILAIGVAFSKKLPEILFQENIGITKLITFVTGVIFILFHGYIYVWSGNSKKIINEFKNTKSTRFGTFAVIFYIVFSYIFFVVSGLLLWPSIHAQLP